MIGINQACQTQKSQNLYGTLHMGYIKRLYLIDSVQFYLLEII